ncbi:hypothetical protein F66182_2543 [Fusarium sp. NRRL 66182]|nr:hypothetical protein F66182_2543 [Fusarium sp. NRRL 66182]
MAEQQQQQTIDDWLEVESVASVISLADSEDRDLSQPTSPSPRIQPALQELAATITPADLDATTDASETTTLQSPRSSSRPESRPDLPSSKQVAKKQDKVSSDTPARNPNDYHKFCIEVIDSLDVMANLAYKLGGRHVSILVLLHSKCRQLSAQAKELDKTLEGYTKHWLAKGSNMAMVDIPLVPTIWDWLSKLSVEIFLAMDELRKLEPAEAAEAPLDPGNMPLQTHLVLASCLTSLEEARDLFSAFLPIIKAQVKPDFDEFQTRHMGFPSTDAISAQSRSPCEPPSPVVVRIRRELYELKDHAVAVLALLSSLRNDHPPPGVANSLAFRSLNGIIETISAVLIKNPTEWIDSETWYPLQRAMSYPQFLTLDPEVLRDITLHLQEFQHGLDIKPVHEYHRYSTEMIRNHQCYLLIEGGRLQELCSILEFTRTLLMVDGRYLD